MLQQQHLYNGHARCADCYGQYGWPKPSEPVASMLAFVQCG